MNIEKYLSSFFNGTKNPSLKAMDFFMDEFHHPEKEYKIIHIAGTNGKGSCTEMMTKILINSGFTVGKFMSPHLIKYNERISVQNNNITDFEMEDIIIKLKPKIDYYNEHNDSKVTLFELETAMALIYFREKKCDFVVLETGLGGLYDCTNIVNPLISIITNIGFDHMNILGNTLEEIAVQKAGIIKEKSDTIFPISDNKNVNDIIIKTCKEKNNQLHLVDSNNIRNYTYNSEYQKFDYKSFKNLEINLKGEKQLLNTAIIIECIEVLRNKGFQILDEDIRNALKSVVHKGRLEIINKEPLMIFDGAHNQPAIMNFMKSLEMYYSDKEEVFIVSILKTKDYKSVLKELLNKNDSIFIFTDGIDKEKYVSKEELLKTSEAILKENNKTIEMYIQELKEAIDFVIEKFKDKVIFFVGSFYIYGTVMEKINDSIKKC